MKNIYGYESFLDVPLPPGEVRRDIRFPRFKERFLNCHGRADICCDQLSDIRIILGDAPKNEYGYATYEEVPIPEGWMWTGEVRIPNDNEDALGTDGRAWPDAKFGGICAPRMILKRKTKRYAVAKVELPDGFEIAKEMTWHLIVFKAGTSPYRLLKCDWKEIEE